MHAGYLCGYKNYKKLQEFVTAKMANLNQNNKK